MPLFSSVLNELYNHAGNRLIILSTFDPDVALLLRLKQPRFPVCFLTESAGPIKTPDPRRASLQQAIQWARAIHCWGIVTECWPVVNSPELVQLVRRWYHCVFTTRSHRSSFFR
jgi:glycerophosphodiester phosphodiesterase